MKEGEGGPPYFDIIATFVYYKYSEKKQSEESNTKRMIQRRIAQQ